MLDIPINLLKFILKLFPANLFNDAKHPAFSINDLADMDKTKHNYNQQHKTT